MSDKSVRPTVQDKAGPPFRHGLCLMMWVQDMAQRITIVVLGILLAGVAFGARGADAKDDKSQKVTIKNLKYDPPKLTIKPGETVQWINKDDNDHTVIADDE